MQDNKTKRLIAVFIIVIGLAVAGGAVYAALMQPADNQAEQTSQDAEPAQTSQQTEEEAVSNQDGATTDTVIVFTDDGFAQERYTAQVNQEVTVRNDSSTDLEFSSDNHPTHQDHPELNTEAIGPGETTTFTPTEVGELGFHDHINAQYTGVLVVTE